MTTISETKPWVNTTVRFTHLKTWLTFKDSTYITAAYDFKEIENIQYLNVGFSFCSLADHYCKETGRQIAFGRLKSTPFTVIVPKSFKAKNTPLLLENYLAIAANTGGIELPSLPDNWTNISF
jgi:hypothetical protein